MQNPSRRTVLQSAASLAGLAAAGAALQPALAQSRTGPANKPVQPWTVMVPYKSGGRSSFVAERLFSALAEAMEETVSLEHKSGGSAAEIKVFAQLPADSRALMLWPVRLPRRGAFAPYGGSEINASLEPVALVARDPVVLCMSTQSMVKFDIQNLEQLLRYIRKHPGKLTIAADNDSSGEALAAELFKSMSQTYITRMSTADVDTDIQPVVEGKIDLIFEHVYLARSAIQAGTVVPLAYTASPTQPKLNWARMGLKKTPPLLYDVPEFSQYEMYRYYTLFAPPSMAATERALISVACTKALALPDYKQTLLARYALPNNLNREQFLALENQEEARWRKARGRW